MTDTANFGWPETPLRFVDTSKLSRIDRLLRVRAYRPTAADIAALRRHFPDCQVTDPPWPQIQAKLVKLGAWPRDLELLTPPAIMAMLDRGSPGDEDRILLTTAAEIMGAERGQAFDAETLAKRLRKVNIEPRKIGNALSATYVEIFRACEGTKSWVKPLRLLREHWERQKTLR